MDKGDIVYKGNHLVEESLRGGRVHQFPQQGDNQTTAHLRQKEQGSKEDLEPGYLGQQEGQNNWRGKGKQHVKDDIITIAWHMPTSFEPLLYAVSVIFPHISHFNLTLFSEPSLRFLYSSFAVIIILFLLCYYLYNLQNKNSINYSLTH